jgi:glycogen debranching enzyme
LSRIFSLLVSAACLLQAPLVLAQQTQHPVATVEPTGSTISDVQKRMQEGAEAELYPGAQRNSPDIALAADELWKTLTEKLEIDPQSTTALQWKTLIADARQREFKTLDIQESEIAHALRAVTNLISTDRTVVPLTRQNKLDLAISLLQAIDYYPEPHTDDPGTNNLLAIIQTLLYKYPGIVAQATVSLISKGTYVTTGRTARNLQVSANLLGTSHTNLQQLLLNLALSSLPPEERQSIDTLQLQQIYNTISGTEKGSFVLKNGSPFILSEPDGGHRLFADDTDYFNWSHQLDGQPLILQDANESAGYAGRFIYHPTAAVPLKITEDTVIEHDVVAQRISLQNTSSKQVDCTFSESVDAPFADMFVVRGWSRPHIGKILPFATNNSGSAQWSYKGLDGKIMYSSVSFAGVQPTRVTDKEVTWKLSLAPQQAIKAEMRIGRQASAAYNPLPAFDELRKLADDDYQKWCTHQAQVITGNEQFNKVLEQAYRDIYILRQNTPRGPALAAGLPWFATAFGRDDTITCLQTLIFMPELSRDVLRTLAHYQGSKVDAETAERPGKIMHELRVGEMARNHEIPFAPYYGTVDATALWLLLLGRYVERSGDTNLAHQLRPNMDLALQYLAAEVKRGNGYLTYGGADKEALSNQGWKDSGDSVFYSDGKLAKAPIALCEVQGYLYEAWLQAAKLKRLLGANAEAEGLELKAAALKQRFQKDFWMPRKNYLALALDGQGRQCDIITSNPGQVLMSGLLTSGQANAVAHRLMEDDKVAGSYSGFGIRTLACNQPRYFSNSYHNGSVWPHDNSIIGLGLHDYMPQATADLMGALLQVTIHEPDLRLPELFGGYARDFFNVPIPYPVSCKPQAWAAGSMLLLLVSNLGLHLDSLHNQLIIDHPCLPAELGTVRIMGLALGNGTVNLRAINQNGVTHIDVLENKVNAAIQIKP